MRSFEQKVAAITGAGSGIGRALAVELAGQGCELALADINEAGLAETVARVAPHGTRVTSVQLDVSHRDQVEAWAARVVAEHGRANLIFNNAGVGLGASVEGMTYEDLEWLMGINFWGVVYGTKAFLPHLKAAGEGHVVNISSVFGIAGIPSQSAYNASKFAVRGFTEALRQELDLERACVSATSVHPGGVKTSIARNARMSTSLRDIGLDDQRGAEKFERMFITTPARAARVILEAVRANRRRVLVGADAKAIDLMVRLMPSLYQRLVTGAVRRHMR